jgi:hypothetical protein
MGVDRRHQCVLLAQSLSSCLVLVFLSCGSVIGFGKGEVKIVIELGVLKSGKRKRVW